MRKTVVLTGGSRGMGLAAGRQLAEKGANVVIVARDKKKLLEALEHIRVRHPSMSCLRGVLSPPFPADADFTAARSIASRNPAFSSNQCGSDLPARGRTGHRRDGIMELGAAGHRMVLCRDCPPDPVHRHTSDAAECPDEQQLFYEFVHGTCNTDVLAAKAAIASGYYYYYFCCCCCFADRGHVEWRTSRPGGPTSSNIHRLAPGLLQHGRLLVL